MGSNSAGAAAAPHQKYPESVERIHLEVSPSGLEATVTFNLPENELSMEFRDKLAAELNVLLRRCGIVYGIDSSLLNGELRPAKAYIIARGTPAEDGRDAVVRMYELMEAKPEIRRDGSVDYYDLRLINRVRPGDWLGERIEPTNGTAGMTVRGEAIKPRPGRTIPLIYDRNSVREVALDGKTQLVSRLSGAVCYTNDKISVSNHLEIKGDVGVSTGNIKFDGYLTINGTICDGFSVEASKDIEINGNLGVGSAKSIISTDGSIYIKGAFL